MQQTNFSGRRLSPRSLKNIARDLLDAVNLPGESLDRLARLVDVDKEWPAIQNIFSEAMTTGYLPKMKESTLNDFGCLFERYSNTDKVQERLSRNEAASMLQPSERRAFDMLLGAQGFDG